MAPIGKLYTYPNNPRAFKAMIAAKYNGVEIELPSFTFGSTNKEASFVEKFPFGKVPAFEGTDGTTLAESNAISFYVASQKKDTTLFGHGVSDAARIQMYINLADNEITPAAATWIYPILGFVPYNKQNSEKAKEDIKRVLGIFNSVLATRTYLVGEAPTLADIHVVVALLHLYKLVFEPSFRAPFANVNRYFNTLINQPEFKSVIGEVTLCEKMAVYNPSAVAPTEQKKEEKKPEQKKEEKKAEPKKEEKKPEPKKEEEEEEEESFEDKRGPNPLDQLPPSKFNLENWKRLYSNSEEKEAIKFFWENIDLEGFSIWSCKYKYNEENKLVFMSSNLLGGFFQRLESARKYAFGTFGIFGEDNKNDIQGIWVFRGQDVPFEVKDCPDYESWDFTKISSGSFNEEDKKDVNAFLAWQEIDGLAKFKTVSKKFNTGKTFK